MPSGEKTGVRCDIEPPSPIRKPARKLADLKGPESGGECLEEGGLERAKGFEPLAPRLAGGPSERPFGESI
jgi:hypothetical protein